jgi:arylsulfatase A-like enzyme
LGVNRKQKVVCEKPVLNGIQNFEMEMKMKSIILVAMLLGSVAQAAKQPNVIVIVTDDLGYGDLSCFNADSKIRTPNIDRIAEQGVKLTSFHVNPVCVPSRVSLMSGQYTLDCEEKPHAARNGIKQNVDLLPQLLKNAGYVTGGFGKWHLGNGEGDHPIDRGFDEWFGFYGGWMRYKFEQAKETHIRHIKAEPHMQIIYDGKEKYEEPWEHLTDLLTDKAVGFVTKNKDNPFFLFLSYNAPHGWLYHETHPEYSATDEWVETVKKKYNLPDETPMQRNLIDYIAVTEHMDARIGDLLAVLEKENLDQDTLVVFMSDNGAITPEFYYTLAASGNNGGLRGGKAVPYEGGVRVPMMMRCPAEIAANKTISGFTMGVDILPTILDFAGIPAPETNGDHPLRGISLMPYLQQPQKPLPQREAFFINNNKSGVGIIKDPWKLVTLKRRVGGNKDLTTGEGPSDGWILFNLDDDIGERKDLSKQYPEKTEELLSFWKDYNRSIGRTVME